MRPCWDEHNQQVASERARTIRFPEIDTEVAFGLKRVVEHMAASAALATGATFAGDMDDTSLAANQAVMERGVQISPRSAAQSPDMASTQGQETSPAAYGADPDPSKFDRVGLETWWAKYSKEHPAH
jgi:hypothetical protein